jgi:alcohol dehydrogenase class IV
VRPASVAARLGSTRFIFGWGSASQLPGLVSREGRCVLVTTSPGGCGQADLLDELAGSLAAEGCLCERYSGMRPNPDVADVEQARGQASGADVIVGVGGGSVLDASKALAVVAASEHSAADWLEAGRVADDQPRKRLVLVPTTAGTGSELSHGAILSDRARGVKGGLRGARLAPDVALVDPALTRSAGAALTARTAFDLVTHAVESYVSDRATATSRMLSIQALGLVARSLSQVRRSPDDPDARSDLSYAASLMGLNLASVGTCLPHRMQYAIGGVAPSVSHGQGLAWIYPSWVKRAFEHAGASFRDLWLALGLGMPGNGGEASEAIRRWLLEAGLEVRPPRGVDGVAFDAVSLAARTLGPFDVDPIPDAGSRVEELFREILA